jgi:hypothetical protein
MRTDVFPQCERRAAMDWIQIVVTPLVTGVLVFLIQLLLQERMKRRLTTFETQFSKLHERRAEAIAKLYDLLVQIEYGLRATVYAASVDVVGSWDQRIAKRLQLTDEAIKEFEDYFQRHRIYLPKSLAVDIQRFIAQSKATWISCALGTSHQGEPPPDDSQQEQPEVDLKDASEEIKEKIAPLKTGIEDEFRELLGG